MDLHQRWSDLHQTRLDWAECAYSKFLRNLDPELQHYLVNHEEEVSVVLYGITQVGKTTLLLKVLGIRAEFMLCVANILRGKQTSGNSATVMATRYRKSEDELWRLRNGEEIFACDADGMESALAELRKKVEGGRYDASSLPRPIEISIPSPYFDKQNRYVHINILDLPGANPKNPNEEVHVRKIAERYVPTADLILLVGRANYLPFLKQDTLHIPQLEDWRYVPQRFRIITTYSISPETSRDKFRKGEISTKHQLRDDLFREIKTHADLELPDNVTGKYFYPLEYGESWSAFENAYPTIFQQAQPVVDELFDDLCQDIAKSATKHNRIMQAAQLHVVAGKIKKQKLDEFKEQLQKSSMDRDELNRDAEEFKKASEEVRKSVKLKESCLVDEKQRRTDISKSVVDSVQVSSISESVGTNTKHFFGFLNEQEEKLLSCVSEMLKNEMDISPSISMVEARKIVNGQLQSIRTKLGGYSRKEYYPSMSDSYENDKKSTTDYVNKAMQSLHCYLIELAVGHTKTKNSKLNQEIAAHRSRDKEYTASEKRKKIESNNLQCQIDLVNTKKADYEARINPSLEQSRDFSNALNSEFSHDINQRKQRIKKAVPVMKFIELCAAVQVAKEYKKLISLI